MDETGCVCCGGHMHWDLVVVLVGGLAGGLSSYIIANIGRRRLARDSIIDIVEDIQAISVTYWSKSGRIETTEDQLIRLLEALGTKVEARYTGAVSRKLQTEIDDLHHFVTGDLFGTVDRKDCSERVKRIRRKVRSIKDLL